MNHNELTNHITRLRHQRPDAEPTITWDDWFTHCSHRTDYAAQLIRQHRQNPTDGSGELITWGVVAASLTDNNTLTTPWLGRYLSHLWELASTPGQLNRTIHPIDHLLSLATQRTQRDHNSHQRHHRIARRLQAEPQPDHPDPTAAAAIATITLSDANQRCETLTGLHFDKLTALALATHNNPTERQQLHRSRRQLRTLTAA